MKVSKDFSMVFATCVAGVGLERSHGFVQNPLVFRDILPQRQRILQQHTTLPTVGEKPALSRLRMAKKGSSGSKRKKKKASSTKGLGGSSGATTTVADVEPISEVYEAPALDEFEDAGGPMKGGAGFGSGAAPPGLLKDGEIGTDEAREAKIQETLKKMGVKAATKEVTQTTRQEKSAEIQTMSERINSIFDLIPAEVQLGLERFFIAGFVIFLAFFVAVGVGIGTEAYFLSTTGEMPKELDEFIVNNMQPYFTPSLLAIFGCSVSLGILKLGQMGQESVVYREDD